ncbi:DUF222 domain-containing protein [Microbacterium sp.]|uniref:HNH endonuclease signature motif containing protein n=1 Tax=Microbacterium sp. TaxID=51671 RepID=UPI003C708528
MTSLPQVLESIARQLADVRAGELSVAGITQLDPAGQIDVLRCIGRLQRLLDGITVDVVDDIESEDAKRERANRVTARAGCRSTSELLQRLLLIDAPAARRYSAAADAAHEDIALVSGERLPGDFPALSAALRAGEMSLAGYLACVTPLRRAQSRITPEDLAMADALLARAATGRELSDPDPDSGSEDDDRAPQPTVSELAGLTAHVLLRIDPDGACPADGAGERSRTFAIGRLRDGAVPVRGVLLPEVAAMLQRLMDAYNNPRVQFAPSSEDGLLDIGADADADAPPLSTADARTPGQKRHDAFAAIVGSVAAAEGAPQLGGAAPTLVVSVDAADLAAGAGRAHLQSTEWDVPLGVAMHAACAGGVQRVLFDDSGVIIGISTSGRIFTPHQRKAIVMRDGGCLIPGCDVRGDWCEIHHVREWARGGPTHTDNGVALCWHHHRTLETSGWQIRMRDGVPEIRGPSWWDPYCRWRSPGDAYRAVDRALAAARGSGPGGR